VQSKLHRPGGSGLRTGPWSKWIPGTEPVINLRAPTRKMRKKARRRKVG
jgi:hypothetical protein